MRYWIPFLIAGVIVVGVVAFLHSERVEDTLIAVAVFIAISPVVWQPLRPNNPDSSGE